MVERDVGDSERRSGSDDCEWPGIALRIRGKNQTDNLALAGETFREQRADRPVRQAAGENFLLGRAAFTFQVTAGNAARGVRILAVIHCEREKRSAGFGLLVGADCRENNVVARTDDNCPVGLLGNLTGLDGKGSTV
jgi:hypothetical protein